GKPLADVQVVAGEVGSVRLKRPFGADDALGDGRGREMKAPRNLLGGQTSDHAKGQRDLRVDGQQRMAATDDQAQPVIGNLSWARISRFLACGDEGRGGDPLPVAARIADDVTRAVAAGSHEPRTWTIRHSLKRPSVQRDKQRFLYHVLRRLQV